MAQISGRYECFLSEEDLAKAVSELNEPANNEERLKRIDDLRNAFYKINKDISLMRNDDAFILCFLRARKFDHDRALKILTNYHKQLQSWPEVYEKIQNPFLIEHVFSAGCIVLLSGKAVDGSAVLVGRPGKVENAVLIEFAAAILLSIQHLLQDEKCQIYGISVIEDFSYIGFGLARQMRPDLGKRLFGLLQDAMPIRLKSVNMVNQSTLFNIIYAVIRPFIKSKLKRRLKLHGNSFVSLHKIIHPSFLPSKYGGTGPDLDGEVLNNWRDAVIKQNF